MPMPLTCFHRHSERQRCREWRYCRLCRGMRSITTASPSCTRACAASYLPRAVNSFVTTRVAKLEDAAAIARIYNEGIEDRIATFETRPRTIEDVRAWFDGIHPIVVVEDGQQVIAFGATSTYRPRECYAGIAETSVYVARSHRRRGAGRIALQALIEAASKVGFWKLLSQIFP